MRNLLNAPTANVVIAGVSRDCFPEKLTRDRVFALAGVCSRAGLRDFRVCDTVIQSEADVLSALQEANDYGANAAVIYLGNFGPEGPATIFAEMFPGPVMFCAAAEESKDTLMEGRGDALCGLLNASYNIGLRSLNVHLPENPVGLPHEIAEEIEHFQKVAQVWIGVRNLKIISFGPRPQDFYACNAPIKPLYDLGIEVMENSELDLLQIFEAVDPNDPDVREIATNMAVELGEEGNPYNELLPRLARFELALLRFAEANLGSRSFAAFANKCWPGFEKAFGFVPCYVNSRMGGIHGMPVACEVDIYGALSQYMAYLASGMASTLLDINNSVPADLVAPKLTGREMEYFMGFHCGNTPSARMKNCAMNYQIIMHRLMEPEGDPNITRGTLEGQIAPGDTTIFRMQAAPDGEIMSYMAQGRILDVDPCTFGGTGVFEVPGFGRFYRHVLVGRQFPHHTAVGFRHCGKVLYDAAKLLGITPESIYTPLPSGIMYPGENPFAQ